MTQKERETCARLYYLYSQGEVIEDYRWNDNAANELYAMILHVQNCSQGIAWLPSIPSTMPTTPAQAGIYIFKYFYDSLKKQDALNKSETAVVLPCVHRHFKAHRSVIQAAIMGF